MSSTAKELITWANPQQRGLDEVGVGAVDAIVEAAYGRCVLRSGRIFNAQNGTRADNAQYRQNACQTVETRTDTRYACLMHIGGVQAASDVVCQALCH